jgi:hypothetical protein
VPIGRDRGTANQQWLLEFLNTVVVGAAATGYSVTQLLSAFIAVSASSFVL